MLRWTGLENIIVAVGIQSSRKPLEGKCLELRNWRAFHSFWNFGGIPWKADGGLSRNLCLRRRIFHVFSAPVPFPLPVVFSPLCLVVVEIQGLFRSWAIGKDKGEVLWRAGAISSPKITAFIQDQSIPPDSQQSPIEKLQLRRSHCQFSS
jgi:hypothetical protein